MWENADMKDLLLKEGIPFADNRMEIPKWARRIKLDVGLSVNAPHSQVWLEKDSDLFVIGFEPLRENIRSIMEGTSNWPINLNPEFIGKRMWIIPCALGNISGSQSKIYITAKDPGCSSLLMPRTFEVKDVLSTQIWKLSDFLEFIPWNQFNFVEHLKIDVQGMDFEVLKGAEEYLNRILFITLEVDTDEYTNTTNDLDSISNWLKAYGFKPLPRSRVRKAVWNLLHPRFSVSVKDPTFFNARLRKQFPLRDIFIYQHS
jgi:FkbM family methyltransferase